MIKLIFLGFLETLFITVSCRAKEHVDALQLQKVVLKSHHQVTFILTWLRKSNSYSVPTYHHREQLGLSNIKTQYPSCLLCFFVLDEYSSSAIAYGSTMALNVMNKSKTFALHCKAGIEVLHLT